MEEPTFELTLGCGWCKRFPDALMVLAVEGGAAYVEVAEGAFWIILDESALASFMDEDDWLPVLSVKRYADRGLALGCRPG